MSYGRGNNYKRNTSFYQSEHGAYRGHREGYRGGYRGKHRGGFNNERFEKHSFGQDANDQHNEGNKVQRFNKFRDPVASNPRRNSFGHQRQDGWRKDDNDNYSEQPETSVNQQQVKTLSKRPVKEPNKKTTKRLPEEEKVTNDASPGAAHPTASAESSSDSTSSSDSSGSSEEEAIPKMPRPIKSVGGLKPKKEKNSEEDVVCLGKVSNIANLVDDVINDSQPCVICSNGHGTMNGLPCHPSNPKDHKVNNHLVGLKEPNDVPLLLKIKTEKILTGITSPKVKKMKNKSLPSTEEVKPVLTPAKSKTKKTYATPPPPPVESSSDSSCSSDSTGSSSTEEEKVHNTSKSQPCVICKKQDHTSYECRMKCKKCCNSSYECQMVCKCCGETYGQSAKSLPLPPNPFTMFKQFMQFFMSLYYDPSAEIMHPHPHQFDSEMTQPVEVTRKDIANSKHDRKRTKLESKKGAKKIRPSMGSHNSDSDSELSSTATTSTKKRKKRAKTAARDAEATKQQHQQLPSFRGQFPGSMPFGGTYAPGYNPMLAFSQMMGYNPAAMNFTP